MGLGQLWCSQSRRFSLYLFDEPPPRRSDFDGGSEGRAQYHAARAEWYRNITRSAQQPDGMALDGSLADQNDLFDRIARRYRQYSDR